MKTHAKKACLSLQKPFRLAARVARRGAARDEGGSLVEFAILLPFLFVIVAMAATFSMAFYNLQQLACATTTAVELVAAQQVSTNDPCQLTMNAVQGTLPGWTAANITYTLTVTNAAGTATPYPSSGNGGSTAFTCKAAGAGGSVSTKEAPNTPIVLTVSYSYSWLSLPNFNPFGPLTPSTPLTATETAMAD
jgi:Flp pilus assembly protein TadG